MPRRHPECPLPGTPEGRARHRGLHQRICAECLKVPGPARRLPVPKAIRSRAGRAAYSRLARRFPELWTLFYAVELAKAKAKAGLDPGLDMEGLEKLLADVGCDLRHV